MQELNLELSAALNPVAILPRVQAVEVEMVDEVEGQNKIEDCNEGYTRINWQSFTDS